MPVGNRVLATIGGVAVLGVGGAVGWAALKGDDAATTTAASGSTGAKGSTARHATSSAAGTGKTGSSTGAPATTAKAPPKAPPKPRPTSLQLPAKLAKRIPGNQALWRVRTTKPLVALTFDDGPGPYTERIAAILDRYGAKATFFVIGRQVGDQPQTLRALVAKGHAVGNHTWSHKNLRTLDPAAFRAQVYPTSAAISAAVGGTPTLLRPPYGASGGTVDARIRRAGMVPVLWSCDPADFTQPGAKVIAKRVLDCVHAGSIVLLHDGGGKRDQEIAALPVILAGLKARGLRSVTVPELLAAGTPQTTGVTF